ncbi:23S rRNA (guanosine(2251)-2'-O)-methyltransferase RlmB [Alicyclobacillus shizuokensis]|uniref:23S rRNA (guanosine(2251)-2'-O)-methyltransferase RlmB n=1 Tax=Alicyclobacillus shizuokensis TaxID=392014 RepID=UPI0008352765|nr:23S rRNA (guanosine(2251)-2'-O)-methyltransferase RlmB [Alicyclobacillus shizuokensis]
MTTDKPSHLLAGRRPVLEALKAGRPISRIVVAEGAEGGSLQEILARARRAGIVVQRAPRASLARLAGVQHQGVVAYAAAHTYAEFDEVLAPRPGSTPLLVLLDGVADPHNLGAILRTADATGVQGVVVAKRRSAPLSEVVAKAAAGALEYVPVARVSNLVQAMERLKSAGYWLVGTDVAAETGYTQVDYTGPTAVVIGAEGKGLSRLVKEHCDYLVRLPMQGSVQSLNASVAAGVLLYEVVRQRQR